MIQRSKDPNCSCLQIIQYGYKYSKYNSEPNERNDKYNTVLKMTYIIQFHQYNTKINSEKVVVKIVKLLNWYMVMVADKQTKIMLSNQTMKEKWGK